MLDFGDVLAAVFHKAACAKWHARHPKATGNNTVASRAQIAVSIDA
jgi:hypothetical protein